MAREKRKKKQLESP